MTKTEIQTILDRHEKWRAGKEGGGRADLSGANLRGANLRYANLRSANLRYANLRNADLCNANLLYADLTGADLSYADLRGAELRYANLRSADLRNADLRDADLRDADLRDTNLRDADMRGTDLRGADLLTPTSKYHWAMLPGDVLTYGCASMTLDEWGSRIDELSDDHEHGEIARWHKIYLRALIGALREFGGALDTKKGGE